jgi:hypothetical protein
MSVMEFNSSLIIDHISIFVNSVSSTADDISSFIDKLPVLVLFNDWFSISVVIKVSSRLMWVKVMFLNIEWCWNITLTHIKREETLITTEMENQSLKRTKTGSLSIKEEMSSAVEDTELTKMEI